MSSFKSQRKKSQNRSERGDLGGSSFFLLITFASHLSIFNGISLSGSEVR